MCGRGIIPDRDEWALDKHGDALCHDCHIQAVLLLKTQGVDWEGQTFGYELGAAEQFCSAPEFDTTMFDDETTSVSKSKPGRNEQCPCGSGKKYKRCCGK
jgi:hypothetical protein